MAIIEYDCDGKGNFYLVYVDDDGVISEPQVGLSFFQASRYNSSRGKGIPLIRSEGLAKRIIYDKEMKNIHSVNNRK